MPDIKRILFPTDFSETAELAKAHAISLARCFSAEVVALHVRTIFKDDPEALASRLRSNNGNALKVLQPDPETQALAWGEAPTVPVVVLRDIFPAGAILNYLEHEGADLVVMGTHGRTGLKHFMLGSVSEEVVRESPCPVVTVGPRAKPFNRYNRILVGFDYSVHSRLALRQAASIARKLGARLEVLFVVHQSNRSGYQEPSVSAASRAVPVIEKELGEEVRNVLGPDLATGRLKVTATIGAGKTAKEIAEFSEANDTRLIVLGTHGFSGLNRLLLGSTSEQVMRIAGCPVMTVRPEEPTKALGSSKVEVRSSKGEAARRTG